MSRNSKEIRWSMNRRQFLQAAGVGAASIAALVPGCLSVEEDSAQTQRPNVLFIFDDQLRADACSIYGGKNIETPNIDLLARQGVRFTNATSTCPLCTPFRGMLQTGRYPTHSGLVLNWVEANPGQRCIGHIFRDAGYQTGFIGKWHLSAGRLKKAGKYKPNKEAIQAYAKENANTEFTPPGENRLGYDHWETFNFHTTFQNWWFYRDEPEKIVMPGYETDGETDLAIKFMEKNKDSNKPFFLMVAPHPPHPPFGIPHVPAGYLEKIPEQLHWSPNVNEKHPRRRKPLAARCYYAMAKNMDDNVGRIMKYLDASGLADNTIVVFTADHGEQHGSHDRVNKMVPYAESVNIPLIIRWPSRVPAGITSDELYSPMDHMATLCGMLGLSPAETCDGTDLSKVVLGKGKVNRDEVLMMNYVSHWDYFQTATLWPEWRGVRTKQFTYVKWLTGQEELYDNVSDPYQLNNLVLDQKDLPQLKKMRNALKELLGGAHDDFLAGAQYADWYDDQRNLMRTALGPV
ncbi:MAG: sulfatase-like hydrolase/transferase [Sedimentisphaerales bacterium]|nr:sulfatase-like hydrolase/transferase [Sedimentisphaerales bacterium]